MMEPMLVDLAERLDGRLAVARVDVQAYPDLAARCGVMNLPTLVLYRGGQPIEQFSGYMPLRALEERVLKAL
jgi:thioredoxin-like negative regulator of GroEL